MAENKQDRFQSDFVTEERKDNGRKLKIGIIGTGWIAECHMDSYLKMDDVEIVAGADLVPGKADAFFKRYGLENVRTYPSHKELIDNEELDAVSVCTYNMTHAECTIYALEHGVNVLLEKPMCVTLDEAVEIRRAEKKSGKVLSIGFQPRFDANMKEIKKIVESGELGKIYYIQTGGGRRRGIPTLSVIRSRSPLRAILPISSERTPLTIPIIPNMRRLSVLMTSPQALSDSKAVLYSTSVSHGQ